MAAANLILLGSAGGTPAPATLVSILIPARDEAANIAACLDAALASSGVAIEVPLIVAVAVVLPMYELVMLTPGAAMSTHAP